MDFDFKKQLIKAYNKDAELRNKRNANIRKGFKKDAIESFIRIAKQMDVQTILELGSGTGIDANILKNKGFSVLATDLSPKMVEIMRSKKIEAKVCDLYSVSDLGTKFDAIYSMNVLLHVPQKDLKKVMKELSNVLISKGIMYVGVYGRDDVEEIINDETKMGEDRFFNFMSRKTLEEVGSEFFKVLTYNEVEFDSKFNEADFKFRSVIFQKKK